MNLITTIYFIFYNSSIHVIIIIDDYLFALNDFATLEEAEKVINEFTILYNSKLKLEKFDYSLYNMALNVYHTLSIKSA